MERWSESGRWRGRLTARPLPDDAAIDGLPDDARAAIALHWYERASSERRVGESFAHVARALEALGAGALATLATRAVDDEIRHQAICLQVAERYAGRSLPPPARLPFSPPPHRNSSPHLRHLLHVVGQSALNETFATAVLQASFAAARGTLATAALRELLSDEVEHARLGWTLLGSLTPDERRQLSPWVFALLHGNLSTWRETPRRYAVDDLHLEHGVISRPLLESALLGGLREVLIPGFAGLGFDVARATDWAEAGAPTDGSFLPPR